MSVTAPDLADLRTQIRRLEGQPAGQVRGLPVPDGLRSAFPYGLRAGTSYGITGSLTLATTLLAVACQESWCAVVGLPDFGAELAATQSLDLDRVILVPAPRNQWSSVIAALAEVVPVILASPAKVSPGEASRIAARLRERGCTLLLAGSPGSPDMAQWPAASATLHATSDGWTGLGNGHGCLTGRRLRVDVRQRSGSVSRCRLEVS